MQITSKNVHFSGLSFNSATRLLMHSIQILMRGWETRAASALQEAVTAAHVAKGNRAMVTVYQVRNITAVHAEAASFMQGCPFHGRALRRGTRLHSAALTLLHEKKKRKRTHEATARAKRPTLARRARSHKVAPFRMDDKHGCLLVVSGSRQYCRCDKSAEKAMGRSCTLHLMGIHTLVRDFLAQFHWSVGSAPSSRVIGSR